MQSASTVTPNNVSLDNQFELYVINLDRSKERWKKIYDHLNAYGLSPQRISAVDAKITPKEELHRHYSVSLNEANFFINLKPAEIGCFLSHRNALKKFVDESHKPYAIILEDDVEFAADPKVFLQQWAQVLNRASPTMLKLFKRRPISGEQRCHTMIEGFSDHCVSRILRPKLVPLGTQGQIVNRAGAVKLLSATDSFCMPVDVAYQHFWQHGCEVLVATPNQINEISQVVGGTNIGGSQGLTLGFKIRREIGRSWFRLKLKLVSLWHYYRVTQ